MPPNAQKHKDICLANFRKFWFNLVNIYTTKLNYKLQFMDFVSYINIIESDIHARSQQIP